MVYLKGTPHSTSLYSISFSARPSQIKYLFQIGLSNPYCLLNFSKTSSDISIELFSPPPVAAPPSPLAICAILICFTACSNGPSGTDCKI